MRKKRAGQTGWRQQLETLHEVESPTRQSPHRLVATPAQPRILLDHQQQLLSPTHQNLRGSPSIVDNRRVGGDLLSPPVIHGEPVNVVKPHWSSSRPTAHQHHLVQQHCDVDHEDHQHQHQIRSPTKTSSSTHTLSSLVVVDMPKVDPLGETTASLILNQEAAAGEGARTSSALIMRQGATAFARTWQSGASGPREEVDEQLQVAHEGAAGAPQKMTDELDLMSQKLRRELGGKPAASSGAAGARIHAPASTGTGFTLAGGGEDTTQQPQDTSSPEDENTARLQRMEGSEHLGSLLESAAGGASSQGNAARKKQQSIPSKSMSAAAATDALGIVAVGAGCSQELPTATMASASVAAAAGGGPQHQKELQAQAAAVITTTKKRSKQIIDTYRKNFPKEFSEKSKKTIQRLEGLIRNSEQVFQNSMDEIHDALADTAGGGFGSSANNNKAGTSVGHGEDGHGQQRVADMRVLISMMDQGQHHGREGGEEHRGGAGDGERNENSHSFSTTAEEEQELKTRQVQLSLPHHRKDPAKNWSPIDRMLFIKKKATRNGGNGGSYNRLQPLPPEMEITAAATFTNTHSGPGLLHQNGGNQQQNQQPRTWRSVGVQTVNNQSKEEQKRWQLEELLSEQARSITSLEQAREKEVHLLEEELREQREKFEKKGVEYEEQAGIQQNTIDAVKQMLQQVVREKEQERGKFEREQAEEKERHSTELRYRILQHEEVVRKIALERDKMIALKQNAEEERDRVMVSLETEQALLLARVETLQQQMEEKKKRGGAGGGSSTMFGGFFDAVRGGRTTSTGVSSSPAKRGGGEKTGGGGGGGGGAAAGAGGNSSTGSRGPQPQLMMTATSTERSSSDLLHPTAPSPATAGNNSTTTTAWRHSKKLRSGTSTTSTSRAAGGHQTQQHQGTSSSGASSSSSSSSASNSTTNNVRTGRGINKDDALDPGMLVRNGSNDIIEDNVVPSTSSKNGGNATERQQQSEAAPNSSCGTSGAGASPSRSPSKRGGGPRGGGTSSNSVGVVVTSGQVLNAGTLKFGDGFCPGAEEKQEQKHRIEVTADNIALQPRGGTGGNMISGNNDHRSSNDRSTSINTGSESKIPAAVQDKLRMINERQQQGQEKLLAFAAFSQPMTNMQANERGGQSADQAPALVIACAGTTTSPSKKNRGGGGGGGGTVNPAERGGASLLESRGTRGLPKERAGRGGEQSKSSAAGGGGNPFNKVGQHFYNDGKTDEAMKKAATSAKSGMLEVNTNAAPAAAAEEAAAGRSNKTGASKAPSGDIVNEVDTAENELTASSPAKTKFAAGGPHSNSNSNKQPPAPVAEAVQKQARGEKFRPDATTSSQMGMGGASVSSYTKFGGGVDSALRQKGGVSCSDDLLKEFSAPNPAANLEAMLTSEMKTLPKPPVRGGRSTRGKA